MKYFVCIAFAFAALAFARSQQPAQQTAKRSCAVAPAAPASEADEALSHNQFEDAERLYAAMPPSPAATAGVVHAQLGEHKLDQALALAQKESAAHPGDAFLLDLLGQVRYRRGEVVEAAQAYDRANALDPCLARTHYDIFRFMNLNGRYASAQAELNVAHSLAPHDPVIERAWQATQRVPETAGQAIDRLRQRASTLDPADPKQAEQKAALESSIKAIQAQEKGSCELAEPVDSAKMNMWATNSSNNQTRAASHSGIDVELNGKHRRFLLDTGASGLMLSKDAAKSLGLTPEAEVKSSGLGDRGTQASYLAHVESVKIGPLEFHNCMVQVLETNTLQFTDGLLGADVFRSFIVTLDFPNSQLRLSPLPKRPDDTTATPATLGTSGDDDTGNAPQQTIAQSRKDRYIAPEMQDWEPIYRSGHFLIVPTAIGNAPRKLFVLDTGAGENLISIAAAKEVTSVSSVGAGEVRGISGSVNKVAGASSLYIQFAHVRQQIPEGLNALDLSRFSRNSGVEISGFIGYPILHQLVMQIDYRDNLLKVTYRPHIDPAAH